VLGIQLMEALSGQVAPRYNRNPKNTYQAGENQIAFIKAIQSKGLKLVNIGPADLQQGDQKLILGLTWTLILRYEIQRYGADEMELLKWVKEVRALPLRACPAAAPTLATRRAPFVCDGTPDAAGVSPEMCRADMWARCEHGADPEHGANPQWRPYAEHASLRACAGDGGLPGRRHHLVGPVVLRRQGLCRRAQQVCP
jgi:hypothetical protein